MKLNFLRKQLFLKCYFLLILHALCLVNKSETSWLFIVKKFAEGKDRKLRIVVKSQKNHCHLFIDKCSRIVYSGILTNFVQSNLQWHQDKNINQAIFEKLLSTREKWLSSIHKSKELNIIKNGKIKRRHEGILSFENII